MRLRKHCHRLTLTPLPSPSALVTLQAFCRNNLPFLWWRCCRWLLTFSLLSACLQRFFACYMPNCVGLVRIFMLVVVGGFSAMLILLTVSWHLLPSVQYSGRQAFLAAALSLTFIHLYSCTHIHKKLHTFIHIYMFLCISISLIACVHLFMRRFVLSYACKRIFTLDVTCRCWLRKVNRETAYMNYYIFTHLYVHNRW